jgi:AraC-like DNA-binding protein
MGRHGNVHRCGHLGFVPPAHRHDALELNLVTSGRCTYVIDGMRFELGPSHLLFLFPAQEHALVDTSSDHSAWVVHVGGPFVREVCTSELTRPLTRHQAPAQYASVLPLVRARSLARLMRTLFSEVQDDAQFNAGLSFALLTSWTEHHGAQKLVPESAPLPMIDRAIRLLRERTELSLHELSRAVGVSRTVLTRTFKEHTGVSVVSYKNRLRLERFLALTQDGPERSMLDAALAAGFGSYAQFHRVFSTLMGHPPQALRAKNTTRATLNTSKPTPTRR